MLGRSSTGRTLSPLAIVPRNEQTSSFFEIKLREKTFEIITERNGKKVPSSPKIKKMGTTLVGRSAGHPNAEYKCKEFQIKSSILFVSIKT